jgi:4-aminobutyrate aminotransferase-like enzyme
MEFFSTFGGNTVSCAIGLAVLDVVQEEKLQAHALEVGSYLIERLRDLQARHSLIREVRGSGFFIGVELATEAENVVNYMREEGVLLGTEGPQHNVLKIRPPLPFSLEDADLLLGVLGGAIEQEGK